MATAILSRRACGNGAAATRRLSVVVRAEKINPSIEKDNPKVVNSYKASELPKKVRPQGAPRSLVTWRVTRTTITAGSVQSRTTTSLIATV